MQWGDLISIEYLSNKLCKMIYETQQFEKYLYQQMSKRNSVYNSFRTNKIGIVIKHNGGTFVFSISSRIRKQIFNERKYYLYILRPIKIFITILYISTHRQLSHLNFCQSPR